MLSRTPRRKEEIFEISLLDTFRGPMAAAIFKRVLVNAGINSLNIVEYTDGFIARALFYETSRKKALGFVKKLKKIRLKKVRVCFKVLQRKYWQNKWKDDFRPFGLTRRLDIVPAWMRKKYRQKKRIPIFIETASAFGSGLHETTRFMAILVEQYAKDFTSFLDIGTGTGILALVAAKNGPKKICAIDMDKESIRTAKENFRINHYSQVRIHRGDITRLQGKREFDFVAANLITFSLIQAKRNILSFVKPGKYLAVSGISLENKEILKKAFRQLPLRLCEMKKGKEWVALLYQRIR